MDNIYNYRDFFRKSGIQEVAMERGISRLSVLQGCFCREDRHKRAQCPRIGGDFVWKDLFPELLRSENRGIQEVAMERKGYSKSRDEGGRPVFRKSQQGIQEVAMSSRIVIATDCVIIF